MEDNLDQDIEKKLVLEPSVEDGPTPHPDEADSKPFSDFWTSGKQPPIAAMPIHRDSDVYNMKHKERGKAVIFNNKEFKLSNLGKRNGTDEDRDRLRESLKSLGFDVCVYNDPTKRQVFDVIDKLAADDHSDRDCLVVAVFSHGDKNLIHAFDDDYKPNRLWDAFDANVCPTLAGKPKMFFIQACQGDQLDSGTTMIQHAKTMVDSAAASQMEYRIPNKADFLLVNSTFPGYYSWRNTTQGSWFIQALCEVLDQHSSKRDFLSMLTIVIRKVAFNFESCVPGSHMHGKKQIPLITSTLTRDINFF